MRLKLILILLAALLSYTEGRADRHPGIPEITIPSGSVVDFQIDLEDDETTVALDADIDLPDGFSILPQADRPNRTQYTLNLVRNEKMTFEASYPYNDNDIRIILMTADNSPIKGKTGWVVRLPMTTTAQPGTYEARMYNIHMTNTSYNEIDVPEIIVKITVTEPEEIRYTENQLFCNDIEISQGENAELTLSYNSTSDVYEYSADVVFPTRTTLDGDVTFSNTLTSVENFTNNSSWDGTTSKLTISGIYGGGRRDVPAPSGLQEIAVVKFNTASLAAGEYEIKVSNQMLSNDDADYAPAEYVGKLIVKATTTKEKCSTPTISIENNQLIVRSDTKGATYHTSIVAYDHQNIDHGENEPIELVGQYLVTSYASAVGYNDSEPATVTLVWNKRTDIISGANDIEMGTNRMLLLQSVGTNLVISGLKGNEHIALYDISGMMIYQGNTDNETFTIPNSCESGHIYIVKVGQDAIKYKF